MRQIILAALVLAAGPEVSSGRETLEIDMSSFKYLPSTITLRRGEAYTLHLVNTSRGGHDFVAKSFFKAAHVALADQALVTNGQVDVAGGESADIHIVTPAPGRYEAHCSHFMHSAFGMKATIVVI